MGRQTESAGGGREEGGISPESLVNEWKWFLKVQERKEQRKQVKVRVRNAVLDKVWSLWSLSVLHPPSPAAVSDLFHIIFMLKDFERKIFVPEAQKH